MHSHDEKKAQLLAISYINHTGNASFRKKRRNEAGTFGMHLHFANLVDELLTDMSSSDDTLRAKSSGTWRPTCCFSAIDKDMLLYLAILVFSVHENTNAVSHDYRAFEIMVAHAIFCSPRRNGVGGIPFNDFFACLLEEFQDKFWKNMSMYIEKDRRIEASDLLNDYSADFQRLLSTIVPFLAPPNAEWPMWILAQNSYGRNFANLVRASNEKRCDVYVRDAEIKNKNRFSFASASPGKRTSI
ncbi:hypothetical protein Plhal304r1_c077g0163951 [Plasmopara halstedii]